jgi:hypothetical protein
MSQITRGDCLRYKVKNPSYNQANANKLNEGLAAIYDSIAGRAVGKRTEHYRYKDCESDQI